MRTSWFSVVVGALLVIGVGQTASARVVKRLSRVHVPTVPSADAIELSEIAPPSPASTALQTYGDAAIARAHLQPRVVRHAEDLGLSRPYPCDPRRATSIGYRCGNDGSRLGYGQGYAFTPAYVSSPQTVTDTPFEQAPLLNPITGFFFAVNSARFDPHN